MAFHRSLGAVCAAGVVLSAGSLCHADDDFVELVQTENFGFPLSPGQVFLPFQQFDATLGDLVKVSMSIDATIGADITAENDSTIPAPDFGVLISGFMTIDFVDLEGTLLFNEEFTSGGVGPTDGIRGSGPDFWDFGMVSDSGSDMDMIASPADLSAYVGGGTIDAEVMGVGGFTVVGATDSTLTIDNFMANGVATLTYTYKIPAPGALSLLCVGGLAGGRRRRG